METILAGAIAAGGLLIGLALGWFAKATLAGRPLAEEKATTQKLRDELNEARIAGVQIEKLLAAESAKLESQTIAQAELRERIDVLNLELERERKAGLELNARVAGLGEALDQEKRQSVEKLALLTDAKDEISASFKLLAGDAFKQQSEAFVNQNREQVEGILQPLRLKISEFQEGLQREHTDSVKERAALGEQIKTLSDSSGRMTLETVNLTRALRGDSQTQGAWGEMILAKILERSGLREGEEYVTQESSVGPDGRRVRPDVIVNLPGGQRVIIDSKLSLTAYEAFCAAETDDEKAACLARHLVSMKTHIKSLGGKNYQAAVASGLDFVIMFVPIEGALAAAVTDDRSLPSLATELNVAIGTPTTLMMAIRTIASVWQVERRNRNADEIAVRAGRLYEKFVGFIDDMQTVGTRLDSAHTAWGDALSKLSTGRGNLVRQIETLKDMGARTQKALPADLIDPDEPELFPSDELVIAADE